MQEEAILIGISQLGAVFAGFIAIFMVFTQSTGRFSPVDAVRARIIIYSSFAVVLTALLPLVMQGLGIAPTWLWRVATGIYLLLGGMITFDILRSQRALDKTEGPSRSTRLFRLIARILVVGMFVVGALILAGFGQGGYYVLLLTLNLAMVGLTFISFATHRLFV